jgi:predicted dehydrogenase
MRVAIVGTGGVAQRHLGVLSSMPEVEVVGHVSRERSRAEAQARRWGGQPFSDVAELVDTVHPAAVWLCITPERHGLPELILLQRGVPFFVEKPLSADLATAEGLAERIAAAHALVVAVGYKLRALETLPRVRSLLAERPPRMVLAAWHDALPAPDWWRIGQRSGGQVVEQATHLLDLARVLVGEADVVAGLGRRWPRPDAPGSDVNDVSAALLRFATPDGYVPGTLTATCLLHGRQAIQLQLVCEGRVLTLSEHALVVETGRATETEEFLNTTDPFLVEDQAFLDAVRAHAPERVLCTYADALASHRLAVQVRQLLGGA